LPEGTGRGEGARARSKNKFGSKRAHMGAKFVAVALEGDFCDRLAEIARACGARPVGKVRLFTDWNSVAPFAAQKGYLGAACSGGWTVLVDDWELTAYVFDHPRVGAGLALRYRTRVVSAFGHSVTGDCGFRVHWPGGARSVLVTPEGVAENEGGPVPGEEPVDANEYNEYSVLGTLALLGLDIVDGVESSTRCALLRLAKKRGKRAV
jgi:hypothetical protein